MVVWRYLDTLPRYAPNWLKPLLKPAYPLYRKGIERWFRLLPERTVRTSWGPKIQVDPSNFVERRLAYGTFETEVIEFFKDELISETTVFADIGANIGFYSLLYAFEIGPESIVHAFEPLPSNVERFEQNLQENGFESITIHRIALSDATGTASLSVSENHPGEATLGNEPKSTESDRTVDVPQRRFDDIVTSIDDPQLIKIDVEGAEGRVIEGAYEYLTDQQPGLLLEIHPRMLREFGDSSKLILDSLAKAGYESVTHIATGSVFQIESFEDTDIGTHTNLYIR